ncbi:MAG: hypothetical protein IPJ34_14415 [Myxococcales bacterium]|nr:hypothetical protein [Myxococcales bacterium]
MARSQAPTPHTEQAVMTPPPPEPTRSRAPLYVGLVALALAVTALTAYLARKPDAAPPSRRAPRRRAGTSPSSSSRSLPGPACSRARPSSA